MNGLPPGWTNAYIEDIKADLPNALAIGPFGSNLKVSDYRDSGVPLVFVRNIRARAFANGDLKFVSAAKAESLRSHKVRRGDLLVTKMGDPPGDAAIYPMDEEGIITADCIKVSSHPEINTRYLLYAFSSPLVRRQVIGITQGVAQRKVSLARFRRGVQIPLAPSAEQERIVAAIEEVFSRLDPGVVALERARTRLGRMRTALLQTAILDALECAGGEMTPIADLLSSPLANGKSVPDGPESGFPVLRLSAVRDGWIDPTCSKKGAWTVDEARPYMIRKGDYLVVRGNGSKHLVGRGAMVTADAGVAYPDTLIRVRFAEARIAPKYATLIWDSRTVREQIERSAKTTAGIYKINQKDLARITIPVPPVEDQLRIHAAADDALYLIALLEGRLDTQLRRSNKLLTSVLSAAFSGRLAPQDPGDEPAAILLDRIAAERAAPSRHRQSAGNHQTHSAHQKVTE